MPGDDDTSPLAGGAPAPATLAHRYRLEGLLATGGMGAVHRARDEVLDRPVAVKVLRDGRDADRAAAERFRHEARAAAAVCHPNVAAVYDYGEDGGRAFLVMELVEGETLAERLRRHGRLPWPQAFAVAEQVAAGLAAAHQQGLVHRDIKPGNLLMAGDGSVKLADFGIVRALGSPATTGTVLGTPGYVAPEQARGEPPTPATDLYALGCVLFEAVTGRPPYTGPTPLAVALQHLSAPPPDPRALLPGLPAAAAEVLARALRKDPAERFGSAEGLREELARTRAAALPGDDPAPPAAEQPALVDRLLGLAPPAARAAGASRPLAAAAVVALLLAALGGGLLRAATGLPPAPGQAGGSGGRQPAVAGQGTAGATTPAAAAARPRHPSAAVAGAPAEPGGKDGHDNGHGGGHGHGHKKNEH